MASVVVVQCWLEVSGEGVVALIDSLIGIVQQHCNSKDVRLDRSSA